MANYSTQITPRGMSQRSLVDLVYMLTAAVKGICAKLDDDGGVPKTDYEANIYTAIFNGHIEDSKGNRLVNRVTAKDKNFYHISPTGMDTKSMITWLYDFFDMMETLTEQLDADNLTGSNYEALVYTAYYLWKVTNQSGNTLGNGTTYWFNPGGAMNNGQLVDLLANAVYSVDVLTKKLDADGTVTDTNYEALWDTAVILMQIEDSKRNIRGNALTKFLP
ncbi:MAG: hypothetical protein ABFD76_15325 [Smithella sp.]